MIQLKKILIPTDFSDFSLCAMRYGCEFASRFDSEIHVLNVVEDVYPLVADPGTTFPSGDFYPNDLANIARETIQKFPASDLGADQTKVVRQVRIGVPFLEIVRYARDLEIDLIVIGTHGRSGLAHVLMGSTAEKIVRKSPCPVLTVRPEGHSFVMP
ncbi:universal stress protein [Planctomicrobium sp. SH668]|uniref:universal stress protein n=1 Tax=Planctomicrobium sp. SH668 TaxID=3448126 RepID=UPI003F5BFADC